MNNYSVINLLSLEMVLDKADSQLMFDQEDLDRISFFDKYRGDIPSNQYFMDLFYIARAMFFTGSKNSITFNRDKSYGCFNINILAGNGDNLYLCFKNNDNDDSIEFLGIYEDSVEWIYSNWFVLPDSIDDLKTFDVGAQQALIKDNGVKIDTTKTNIMRLISNYYDDSSRYCNNNFLLELGFKDPEELCQNICDNLDFINGQIHEEAQFDLAVNVNKIKYCEYTIEDSMEYLFPIMLLLEDGTEYYIGISCFKKENLLIPYKIISVEEAYRKIVLVNEEPKQYYFTKEGITENSKVKRFSHFARLREENWNN